MKAVIYARYSSDNQREESIDGQLRECMEFAKYNEMTVVNTYVDRALSAKTDNRPEFQRMIKDSYKCNFDVVIVWKLDRFARNRYDSAHYKALLKKNRVRVISAKETISEGAEGILLESLLEGYAEYYSVELAEKVKRGLTENALKGVWNGGTVPFGYVVNRETQKLEIDPLAADIVREIFDMAYDGKTIKEIFRHLEKKNITRSNGKPLRYNAVRYILSNRTYIGEYNHSGVLIEDGVPAIIDKDRFERVQGELKKNSKAPARHTADDDYLLTTKLFCGKCGAMMVAQAGTSHTGKVHRYYACVRQKKHKCDKKMMHKEKLENFIVYKTMEILKNDSVIEELSALLYNLQYKESTVLPQLEQQLKEREKEIENIVNVVQQGIASQALVKRLGELEASKNEISDAIIKEQIQSPTYTQDEYRMALTNYRKIDITQQDGKRKIIDTFINAIYVYDDHFKIVYNGNNKEETISLEALENSSTLFSSGAPKQSNPNLLPIGEAFGFVVFLKDVKWSLFVAVQSLSLCTATSSFQRIFVPKRRFEMKTKKTSKTNQKSRIIFFVIALTYNPLLGIYLKDFLVISPMRAVVLIVLFFVMVMSIVSALSCRRLLPMQTFVVTAIEMMYFGIVDNSTGKDKRLTKFLPVVKPTRKAFYDWIVSNFEYDYDCYPLFQYFDVRKTLQTKQGICFDFSHLFAAVRTISEPAAAQRCPIKEL